MSGIYIPMKMPKCDIDCPIFTEDICPIESVLALSEMKEERHPSCPLIPVPEHGRLIDADALRQAMYHEAFETDSPMQKWDSGCWIRYKMFERMEEAAPTIIPADKEGDG